MGSLGHLLRGLRGRRGWSAQRLAKAMGVGPAYLCNMERRRSVLTVRQLLKVADGLGTPPYRLLAAGLEDACHLAGLRVRVSCRPVRAAGAGQPGADCLAADTPAT